jgi:phosphatidylserine/phosphatidylglycerophosphate/cardiolipin synthase-like enzyme
VRSFEFSTDVISIVVNRIRQAEEYVRVAIFQLHNKDVFEALNDRLQKGVEIEIFTLPCDSINPDLQPEVIPEFERIKKRGAKLYPCRWNVGDPGRTATAVGRWYLYHGKFIVTDKSAIALSANFTQHEELDAVMIYDNEADKIREYNKKFDELIELFIRKNNGYDGSIRQRIVDTGLPDVLSVFNLPKVIETETHKDHWIQHYPAKLCQTPKIADKLYFTPFDCRGRVFIKSIISSATRFAYVSAETFTDEEFCDFLIQMRLRGLEIKILCGSISMDFTDRIQNMFRELLAHDIKVKTTAGDIHAKLVITEKFLTVSSVNFNKINLGWAEPNQQYWRENTETISVCSDQEIIEDAKFKYLAVFDRAIDIEVKLAEQIRDSVTAIFKSRFNLDSRREVKDLFAKLIVREEIGTKKAIMRIAENTARQAAFQGRRIVEKGDFLSALILHYLSDRKHPRKEIEEKLVAIEPRAEVDILLNTLIKRGLVEKEDDYYRIRIQSLI